MQQLSKTDEKFFIIDCCIDNKRLNIFHKVIPNYYKLIIVE